MKKLFLLLSFAIVFNANAQYLKLLDFNGSNGQGPKGSLISDGTYLYGMTLAGGVYSRGVVFKVKTDGSDYTKLLDFNDTNGSSPHGSLILEGAYLFGMTEKGVFKIKTDGTDFTTLFEFNNNLNGRIPEGSLITDGTYLYGMTSLGGINSEGVIFKLKLDGTNYTKLFDFNGLNGRRPLGSLLLDGTYLYGMTRNGGEFNIGDVFKIKTDGTDFTKILAFTESNGELPHGSLITDGTYLYGMTYGGGAVFGKRWGVIFKIKKDGTGYVRLHDFDWFVGFHPLGSLILEGNFLIGMTNEGGSKAYGTVFYLKSDGTNFSTMYDLGTSSGGDPEGSLISDGTYLYGMTYRRGANDKGVVFKLKTDIKQTNINKLELQNDLSIYPNPGTGNFTLKIDGSHSSYEMEIYNTVGSSVYKRPIDNNEQVIDFNIDNKQGVYFLCLRDANGQVINYQKLIIN